MPTSRRLALAALMLVIIGSISLTSVMARPSFATIRTVDAVQLIGCGASFGAAIFAIVLAFRIRTPK